MCHVYDIIIESCNRIDYLPSSEWCFLALPDRRSAIIAIDSFPEAQSGVPNKEWLAMYR
jgi:hypothetical protein